MTSIVENCYEREHFARGEVMNIALFTAFLLITTLLIITPGPIVTLVISVGATRGRRAALATVMGTTTGNILLISAIALGLNWVVSHAALLFDALRWTGAAYLVWLGVQAWRHAGQTSQTVEANGRAYFIRGLLVALSNPKTIVFFTAFLPQFIDASLPAGPQLAAMCAASVVIAAATDSAWAIAAGLGRAWFMKPSRAKLLGRLSGSALIGGGIWLSLARRPS
jgi:threonine/homoserine/homoserine lactone efflux protein